MPDASSAVDAEEKTRVALRANKEKSGRPSIEALGTIYEYPVVFSAATLVRSQSG